jgi:hypothetical protein
MNNGDTIENNGGTIENNENVVAHLHSEKKNNLT